MKCNIYIYKCISISLYIYICKECKIHFLGPSLNAKLVAEHPPGIVLVGMVSRIPSKCKLTFSRPPSKTPWNMKFTFWVRPPLKWCWLCTYNVYIYIFIYIYIYTYMIYIYICIYICIYIYIIYIYIYTYVYIYIYSCYIMFDVRETFGWRFLAPQSARLSIPLPVRSLGVGCSLRATWHQAMCFAWCELPVWNSSWHSICLDWFYRNQTFIVGSLFGPSFECCWFICKPHASTFDLWWLLQCSNEWIKVLNLIKVWLIVYFLSMHGRPQASCLETCNPLLIERNALSMDGIMPHSGSRRIRGSWLRFEKLLAFSGMDTNRSCAWDVIWFFWMNCENLSTTSPSIVGSTRRTLQGKWY